VRSKRIELLWLLCPPIRPNVSCRICDNSSCIRGCGTFFDRLRLGWRSPKLSRFPDRCTLSADLSPSPTLTLPHGARELRSVHVDDYNVELRENGAFLGDRANKKAFQAILDRWREALGEADPLRDVPTQELYKQKPELEEILMRGDPVAAGLLIGAMEDFSHSLTEVVERFLQLPAWRKTQRIVIGGGFREGRIGELVVGRTAVLLRQAGKAIELRPIRHHPDAAGLIGSVELAPEWVLSGFDGILAVDIGGTNIRTGVVDLGSGAGSAKIWKLERWRHASDEPERDETVDELIGMLRKLIGAAETEGVRLAPFIGIACPGIIRPDGTIERGGQNLPGDWESEDFNLPERIIRAIPQVRGREATVIVHNDAVVQGLSETPFMGNVTQWGVLTIGTGLGNAHFISRQRVGGV
jgi:ROK family